LWNKHYQRGLTNSLSLSFCFLNLTAQISLPLFLPKLCIRIFSSFFLTIFTTPPLFQPTISMYFQIYISFHFYLFSLYHNFQHFLSHHFQRMSLSFSSTFLPLLYSCGQPASLFNFREWIFFSQTRRSSVHPSVYVLSAIVSQTPVDLNLCRPL